jgi:predicted heme/steroid binding protein
MIKLWLDKNLLLNRYLWIDSEHKGHRAVKKLTKEIIKAVYGPGALIGFPVVGTLKNKQH